MSNYEEAAIELLHKAEKQPYQTDKSRLVEAAKVYALLHLAETLETNRAVDRGKGPAV